MTTYNTLHTDITCPHCNTLVDVEIEMRFGDTSIMDRFVIGDRYKWVPDRTVQNGGRPADGNMDGEGYAECPRCGKDFFVKIVIRGDVIQDVKPDMKKAAYIQRSSSTSTHPTSNIATQSKLTRGGWDPIAYIQEMRKSTSPVSAFFLIDSWEAIPRCIQWLSLLKRYEVSELEYSKYFDDVREIYKAGRKVINFDHDFQLFWEEREWHAKLRCHFFDKGRYEIELWLPGVIANELVDQFKNGHDGFWCGFMSPAFYD